LIGAVEDFDVRLVARRAHPGGHRKPELFEHQRRRLSHQAEAEKADAPLLGPHDRLAQPFAVGLRDRIARHVAVQPQHVHDRVFGHHRVATRRLDLAERHLRQIRVVDERLNAGRAAEHRLQVRQRRDCVEIRPDERQIFYVVEVVGLREDADFEVGQLLGEIVAPLPRVADLPVEIDDKQRHAVPPASRASGAAP
jgi:hypothetical protein